MDADYIHRPRDQLISRRENRWSMNSERIDAIVAKLLKPIADGRQSFEVDIQELLEHYLTQAGLRALDAGGDVDSTLFNFPEIALLLQNAVTIYGKKVDFLYKNVIEVSDAFIRNTTDGAPAEPPAPAGPGPAPAGPAPAGPAPAGPAPAARRRRQPSAARSFERLQLAGPAGGRRAPEAPRPPPTLPRMYCELEPRVRTGADAPLLDYAGEPIGLLADFQVAWRLHDGLLVDELGDGSRSSGSCLRPISLLELQAAIQAAAPPPEPEGAPPSPLRTSTPLPPEPELAPPPVPLVKKNRKRRSDVNVDDIIDGNFKLVTGKAELREKLNEVQDFSIADRWISQLVAKRSRHILSERLRVRDQEKQHSAEFAGWSSSEAAAASAEASGCSRALELDSDDDGFFEQSSLGESEPSRAEEGGEPGGALWQARVLRRALAAEAAGGVDVRQLGARVLGALQPGEGRPQRFGRVLRAAARDPPDVSRLLLATLFLANAGNVEIIEGQPLSVNSFSVRVLSTDERLYGAIADEQFLH